MRADTLSWAFAAIMVTGIAQAASVTFAYEGTIDTISSDILDTTGGNIQFLTDTAVEAALAPLLGQTMRIEYDFETDATLNPDQDGIDPDEGRFNATEIRLSLGGMSYTSAARLIRVNLGGGTHAYNVDSTDSLAPVSGPPLPGFLLSDVFIGLSMTDRTANVFTDDSLPLTPPNPLDFLAGGDGAVRLRMGSIEFLTPTRRRFTEIEANFVQIAEVTPVPLPASGLLVLAGLGGLALVRRRHPRRA